MASDSPLPFVIGFGVGAVLLLGGAGTALAYSGDLPGSYEGLKKRAKVNQNAGASILPYVKQWAKEFQFPASLMMALGSIESGYNPNDIAPRTASDWEGDRGGAWGLFQLLLKTAKGLTANNPKTAAKYWPKWDGTGQGLLDPQVSLPMAGFAIGKIFNHYRPNSNAWFLSGLAWNRGQAGVDKLLAANNIPGPGVKYYNALKAQRESNPLVSTLVDSEKRGGYKFL